MFHGKNSSKQFTVFFQLALVMYRLGSNGNSASISKIAGVFGVGDGGTIDRVTRRVFQSILSLESEYLQWPSKDERAGLVEATWDEMPYCIIYTDGMEVLLDEAPIRDKESYFSRTKKYSIKLQGSCDFSLKLRHIVIGYPGSVHDARIFNSCDLALSPLCTQKKKIFNQYFSSYRVRIEHCFGILEEKFQSLKSLPVQIYDEKSHKFACTWIRVCCIVYNMILPYIDVSEFPCPISQEQDEFLTASDVDKLGEAKRMALVDIVLE